MHFSSASDHVEADMAQRASSEDGLPALKVPMKRSHTLKSVLMVPILAVVVI